MSASCCLRLVRLKEEVLRSSPSVWSSERHNAFYQALVVWVLQTKNFHGCRTKVDGWRNISAVQVDIWMFVIKYKCYWIEIHGRISQSGVEVKGCHRKLHTHTHTHAHTNEHPHTHTNAHTPRVFHPSCWWGMQTPASPIINNITPGLMNL